MGRVDPTDNENILISAPYIKNEKIDRHSSIGDFVALDIVGNDTDFQSFIYDLGPGEKIIRRFDVKLRPSDWMKTWYYIMCVLTLGVWWLMIQITRCCRPKTIYNFKATLLVTDKGRLGVWKSGSWGSRSPCFPLCCCVKGNTSVNSSTIISWYSIKDIAHIQHHNVLIRPWIAFLLPSVFGYMTRWTSSLRIFFGSFPNQDLLDAASFTLPQTVRTKSSINVDHLQSLFSVVWYLQNLSKGVKKLLVTAGAALNLVNFDENLTVEIFSSKYDVNHPDKELTTATFLEIQQLLLEIKGVAAVVNPPSTLNQFFTIEKDKCKIVDTHTWKVKIDSSNVPLAPGEVILDAFPFYTKWEVIDFFKVFFTFGLYWLFRLRFRLALRNAVIVTKGRIIVISQNWPTGYKDPVSYSVRSFFLNGYETGYMVRERAECWAELQTSYGCIALRPHLANPAPWDTLLFGMSHRTYIRTKAFLLNLSLIDTPQLYQSTGEAVKSEIFKDIPCYGNESLIHTSNSTGVRFTGTSFNTQFWQKLFLSGDSLCASSASVICAPFFLIKMMYSALSNGEENLKPYETSHIPNWVYQILSCGRLPYFVKQELFLTTHRVWAVAKPINYPWCCTKCFGTKYEVYFWSGLLSKQFIGAKLTGEVQIRESIYSRLCGCLPGQIFAPNVAQSSIALGYQFGSSSQGFPIQLFSFQKKADKGLIEHPDFFEFRRSIGCIQTTRNTYKEQPGMKFEPIKLDLQPLSEKEVQSTVIGQQKYDDPKKLIPDLGH